MAALPYPCGEYITPGHMVFDYEFYVNGANKHSLKLSLNPKTPHVQPQDIDAIIEFLLAAKQVLLSKPLEQVEEEDAIG